MAAAASNPAGDADRAGVKSARRAVELIETFAAADGWMSLADLHAVTGLPRSSLHGLLHTLLEAGWLETDPAQTRYRLGVRALICGTAYLDRDPAVRYATHALEQVRTRPASRALRPPLRRPHGLPGDPRVPAVHTPGLPGRAHRCPLTPPRWARRCWPS